MKALWQIGGNARPCGYYFILQIKRYKRKRGSGIWISLRHCFERDVHVVAGSLTCTCTPVVDVSFVQAAPWFPGLWVASDWQRPCGVLSDGAPAINRSRCVTNLSALSTNFGMCCFLWNMHYLGTLYIEVFLEILWRPEHCTDRTEHCFRILQHRIILPHFHLP